MGGHTEDQEHSVEPARPPLTVARAREMTAGLREAMDDSGAPWRCSPPGSATRTPPASGSPSGTAAGSRTAPQSSGLVGQARGRGGEGEVECVQQADGAQDVPFVRGEVGQGAGDQGGEVVVEVGGGRLPAGAADLEEPHHRQVQVERQAVRPARDDLPDLAADEGLAVAGEPAGEVVVAVLR
ncbi:hypothetical protein GCM10010377_80460 [Streptomyces viridiviolaceus]|uniref:Uncharacterized protein n=1 Tax=Streptomyces viridiviolaceus TaxID=68282 RepID=A0ABW2E5T2_9ACTN|nr:hypothetical protein [Streptomyces viridiviolaceus]GHB78163.1 hypothetical protein GCM10010377_80460 [Streptomyces viridiviolaceus]